MQINLKIRHKGLVLVCVPLIFELLFVSVLITQLRQADYENERQTRAKNILELTQRLTDLYYEVGYSLTILSRTKDRDLAYRYARATDQIPEVRRRLREAVSGNPRDAAAYADLEVMLDQLDGTIGEGKRLLLSAPPIVALAFFEKEKTRLQPFLASYANRLRSFAASQQSIEQEAPEKQRRLRQQQTYVLWIGIIFNIVLAIGLALYFSRSITRRLDLLGLNTARLAHGESLLPPIGGGDEIADLDQVFHLMASALKDAAEKERALQQTKQEFLSMVTHDLRTPLTSVAGTLKMLAGNQYGQLPAEARSKIGVVTRNLDRLIKLINDLLDVDKLESGTLVLERDIVDIDSLIARCVQSLEYYCAENQITIDHQRSGVCTIADPERLFQVVTNLVGNAIKYSPKGSCVTVESREDSGWVEVRVTDQGRGIPQEQREVIFERFKQVKAKDAARRGGTGLGLAICKLIVESHGGKIGVETEVDKGSTFWFRLPSEDALVQ